MRVLITRLSSLGDVIHTWPLADALAANVPGLELAWLVEEELLPLVRLHPAVSEAIPVATRRWRRAPVTARTAREVRQARASLRRFAPELVLDPQGLMKSALWGWLSGAARRVGLAPGVRRERLAGLFYTQTVQPGKALAHVIDANLALLEPLGIAPPYGAAPDGRFLLALTRPPGWRPRPGTIALVPATGGRGKAWPWSGWAELARRLAATGRPVLVLWGPGEDLLARRIAAGAGAGVEAAPATSIVELAHTLAACAAALGGDTGPIHLAAALGAPTLGIYLRTEPRRNGPRGWHVDVVTKASAGAGWRHAHARAAAGVAVEQVLAALAGLVPGIDAERGVAL